jgi:hypothetical protein
VTGTGTEEAADEEAGTPLVNMIATHLGGEGAGPGVREETREIGMGTGIGTGPTGIGEVSPGCASSSLLY